MIFPLIAGVLAAAFVATAKEDHMGTWRAWWQGVVDPGATRRASERLRSGLLDQINYARIGAKLDPLKTDPELEKFLERYATELPCDDADAVTQNLQNTLPRYFKVAVCVATKPDPEELLHEFRPFSEKSSKEMTHFACMLKASAGGLSKTCLAVIGQRLEDFSPEALNARKADAFYNVCPHCSFPHVCRVSYQQHSLIMDCPSCGRTYAVVAVDSSGKFRYVNEFLTGYEPPAKFPKDQSSLQKLFTIWSAVHRHCTYTLDPETKKSQIDAWQTAFETENLQRGDCEDSSIFLADWLEAQGFRVRVVLGRYGDMGGHAWCVVRLDGVDYLLESTTGRPDPNNPPYADIVGSRYVPEIEFDRKAIYVRNKPKQAFSGDYWSSKVWARVEPRNHSISSAVRASADVSQQLSASTRRAERLSADKTRLAITGHRQPAVAPFANLDKIPAGSLWQLRARDVADPENSGADAP
ncbi:MAG: transglutaminase-like domain-containing protein [Verrucomicrobiaceae bacterium]|nr:transglutaminase-like domain-containing protein [Verrucomicrobiaceae bacterium]